MPDLDQLYDIFIIYHPADIRFVRRVDAHMKAEGLRCWVSWDDLSATLDGQAVLKAGVLRSHTVAIALSPKSAESAICNTLIQYAVNHSKRFVTLIVDEHIDVDVHPAIAENPYIFFRDEDVMEEGIQELLDVMQVDDHIELHTELLVMANDWDVRDRNAGLLLPLERVNEARKWLADGANREPKPSEIQVEYIHASRRQKSTQRRGLSIYVLMGLLILGLVGVVISLSQSAQTSQSVADSRSTEAIRQAGTSSANAQLAEAVVGSATAEAVIVADFAQTATSALALADMAVNSAGTADVMQQLAQSEAQDAIDQASIALTAQSEAEAQLVIVSTESENAGTLSAQVLTFEFESERLIETAQSAQNTSLLMARTATAVMVSADEQADIASTEVANLATVIFSATEQLATATAVQFESDNNAGTAVAAEQIAETEANGRSTAEAELESLTDTATQTFQTAQEVNSQALILSAEQALNAGDVDLALALGMTASQFADDSAQVYRVLSRSAELSPSLILNEVSRIELNPEGGDFALIPRTFDRILIFDAESRQVKFELTGHEDDITTLRYSLDGRFLVTASQDGMVMIWSSATGELIHQLERHQGVVNAIAMYPDGQRIVTAGIRPMLVSWDINTGEVINEYFADFGEELLPYELIVSADNQRIIAWSNPRGETVMSQWSADSLDLLTADSGGQVYVGYSAPTGLAWTGGRALPAYANDPNMGDLILWDMGSGQQQLRLSDGFNWTILSGVEIADSTDSLLFMTMRDNRALLGIQSSDGGQRVTLVNIADGIIERIYQSNISAQLTSAEFIDDTRILSTTRDNRLVVWSLDNGVLLHEVGISTRALQDVNVSDDGAWAIVQASGGEVYLWSINGIDLALTHEITTAITGTAMNQSGDRLLIASNDNIILQNTDTQQALLTLPSSDVVTMNRTATHFGLLDNRDVITYSALTGIEQWRIGISFDDLARLYLSPTGNHAVAQSVTGALWLLRDTAEGAIELNTEAMSPSFDVQFTSDSRLLITLHAENAILWEVETASELQTFPLGLPSDIDLGERVKTAFGNNGERLLFFVQLDNNIAGLTDFYLSTGEVNRLTFVDIQQGELTSDGRYLLLTLTDNSIQLIDTSTGEVQRRFVGHQDRVRLMSYQAENNLLVSAGDDNTVIVWDVEAGTLAHQYRHPASVIDVMVSADGDRIFSLTDAGIYRLWQRESLSQLIERITSTYTLRDLTCAERQQYNVLPLCE